ncbi:50S ribosomal protein L27 [Bacillus thuringiensis]|uniref:50S ribosomal protein L27 n=1 Tax=Bacillus thuringiensis TaxID=1428 RepID=UPI00119D5BA8
MLRLHLQFFTSNKPLATTNNPPHSHSKPLPPKPPHPQTLTPPSILYPQPRTKIYPAVNVRRGAHHTLYPKLHPLVRCDRLAPHPKQLTLYPLPQEP